MGRSGSERDKISLYGELELRSRLFQEDHARDCQEVEELEEIVAKKKIEQDKQELMNCPCIKGGILRPSVNCWLKFWIYRTK